MRSHPNVNKKEFDLASFCDLQWTDGKHITECPHKFNEQAVYKIDGEVGLYTIEELRKRFHH